MKIWRQNVSHRAGLLWGTSSIFRELVVIFLKLCLKMVLFTNICIARVLSFLELYTCSGLFFFFFLSKLNVTFPKKLILVHLEEMGCQFSSKFLTARGEN